MKNVLLKSLAVVALVLFAVGMTMAQNEKIQYFRPYDQDGLNIFETGKAETIMFDGLAVKIGGAFSQQFQALNHENTDTSAAGVNALQPLTNGFNLATANLYLDAQFAEGVRLHLATYLSSRHHQETWVKGGYIQFDKLPFLNSQLFDDIMEIATIKVGHMEINYGDAHFRRTDNGLAMYNPLVGNLIMDAFNTEIGAEVRLQKNGLLGMLSLTGGEIKGDVTEVPENPNDEKAKRSPSVIVKVGLDKQFTEDLRFRLTGSTYFTASSRSNSLYSGDRGGSRYYLVMEEAGASVSEAFTSGRYNPGFRDEVTAFMINPFLKYKGLEFFGTAEFSNGKSNSEAEKRNASQFAGELLYRFGGNDNFYIAGRYNTINAETSPDVEVAINRIQAGLGWFVIDNILIKAEYVSQEYKDFPGTSRFYEGKFNGVMVEATVGF